MKRTSLLRVQLEDSRNPGGEKGDVGRRRPGEEEVVHIGFSCVGQMPFSLAARSSLPLCLHLSQKKKMLMQVRTAPHIYISVMS